MRYGFRSNGMYLLRLAIKKKHKILFGSFKVCHSILLENEIKTQIRQQLIATTDILFKIGDITIDFSHFHDELLFLLSEKMFCRSFRNP